MTGQIVLNDPLAPDPASTKLPHLTVGLTHPDSGVSWIHDAKYYQFWNDGTDDGKFTITKVRPGKYTLHAFADGVLGDFAQANITVEAGKTVDLGKLAWKPVRYGRQLWDIGYPDRTGDKFFKGDGAQLLAVGLEPALRPAVPQRHHLHDRQKRLPQGLVLRGGAARHEPVVRQSRGQGPRQPALWLGQRRVP